MPTFWQKWGNSIVMAAILALMSFIALQYTTQDTRLAVTEIKAQDTSEDVIELKLRMTRLEESRERDMEKIVTYLQRIEDKLDRKMDK